MTICLYATIKASEASGNASILRRMIAHTPSSTFQATFRDNRRRHTKHGTTGYSHSRIGLDQHLPSELTSASQSCSINQALTVTPHSHSKLPIVTALFLPLELAAWSTSRLGKDSIGSSMLDRVELFSACVSVHIFLDILLSC